MCAAGALRDGVCAYTALHTHARMAAGHTLLVMDGASVCMTPQNGGMCCAHQCKYHIFSPLSVFWPHVYPVGLLPRSEGSDDVTHATEAHIPGAASTQRRYVQASIRLSVCCFKKLL